MKQTLMLTLFPLTFAAHARAEEVDETEILLELPERRTHVLSADAPREGEDAFSLGVAVFSTTPTLDLRYVRGVSERVSFEGALSSNGAFQRLRLSARYRLSDLGEGGALALRGSVLEIHDMAPPAVLIAGVGPGLMLSFGERIQYTLACDVAWSFLELGDFSNDGRGVQFHPSIGAEMPLGEGLHAFLEGALLIALSDDASVLVPVISGGVIW